MTVSSIKLFCMDYMIVLNKSCVRTSFIILSLQTNASPIIKK